MCKSSESILNVYSDKRMKDHWTKEKGEGSYASSLQVIIPYANGILPSLAEMIALYAIVSFLPRTLFLGRPPFLGSEVEERCDAGDREWSLGKSIIK